MVYTTRSRFVPGSPFSEPVGDTLAIRDGGTRLSTTYRVSPSQVRRLRLTTGTQRVPFGRMRSLPISIACAWSAWTATMSSITDHPWHPFWQAATAMTSLPGMTFQGPERAPVRPIDLADVLVGGGGSDALQSGEQSTFYLPDDELDPDDRLVARRPMETWSFSVGAVHGSARGVLTQSPGLSVRDNCTSSEARST